MAGITGLKVMEISETLFNRENMNCWIMYRFCAGKDSVIELDCGGGSGWDEMCKNLPQQEVRYVLVNFGYVSPNDNVTRNKRVFLMWAPQYSKVKDKVKVTMYSHEAQKILSQNTNFHIIMQGNEMNDVNVNMLMEKIKKHSTVF